MSKIDYEFWNHDIPETQKSPTNGETLKFKTLDIEQSKNLPPEVKKFTDSIGQAFAENPESMKNISSRFSELFKDIIQDPQKSKYLSQFIKFHREEKNIKLISEAQNGNIDLVTAKNEYKKNIITETMLQLDILSKSMLA